MQPRTIALLFLYCLWANLALAQLRSVDRYASISLHGGAIGYLGDLSPNLGTSMQMARGYVGIGLSKQLGAHTSLGLRGTFGRLAGDDFLVASLADPSTSSAYLRNLHFRNNIAEVSGIFQFDVLRQPYHHTIRQGIRPYLMGGMAFTYSDPKAKAPELLGGLWTPLRLLRTEGQAQAYSNWAMALPVGIGLRFKLSNRVDFDVHAAYRFTFSDYLDDASGRYADKGKLSNNLLAQHFSDPSLLTTHAPSEKQRTLPSSPPFAYTGSDGNAYSTYHGFGMDVQRGSVAGNDSYWTVGMGLRIIVSGTKDASQLSRIHQIHHEYDVERMHRRIVPDELLKGRNRFEVVLLKINTKYSDIASSFYRDGILFDSDRPDKQNMLSRSKGNFYNIYYAPFADLQKSELTAPVIFPDPQFRKFNHIRALRIADSDQIILSMFEGHDFRRAISHHQLYTAKVRAEKIWDEVQPMPFDNSSYSVTHAAMNKNGNVLYFASDMPGGYGGTDIYVSFLHKGQWTMPKNLGPVVNTTENELYPFLHADSTLYFASDGHGGFGGLDVYEVYEDEEGNFSKVKNVGAPINSKYNDFGLILDPLKRTGFFSSNRPGGQGSNDIYQVNVRILSASRKITDDKNLVESKEVQLTGIVVDKITEDPLPNAYIRLNNLITNELQIQNADENGRFSFKVMSDGRYEIAGNVFGYEKMEMARLDSLAQRQGNGDLKARIELMSKKPKIVLKGTIRGPGGRPITDALIKLFDDETGQWEEMTSDANGFYKFKLLKGKRYRLYVTKAGYEPHNQEVTTYNRTFSETVVINCELKKKK